MLAPRENTNQKSYSYCDRDRSKWIPRDRGLGLMCSLCRPNLRETHLFVSNAANARSQTLKIGADRFDRVR